MRQAPNNLKLSRKNPKPHVWIVDSAYTGEINARIGVAERLGYGYEIIPLPDGNPKAYLETLRRLESSGPPGAPLVVISGTGEETTSEIADLKLAFQGRLFNVFLASILPETVHPRLREYDLIASPQIRGPNVISTLGIPHRITRQTLAQASQAHGNLFAELRRPLTGLLVGGNTRYCFGFDESHARGLARRVKALGSSMEGSAIATNSRRTPPVAWSALKEELSGFDVHFIDWQDSDREVYHALLAEADIFIVTGDSLSMCSEVSSTGKPLLIDLTDETTECFHRQILGRLFEHGAARPLTDRFDAWTYTPPDPTGAVADAIRSRLGLGHGQEIN